MDCVAQQMIVGERHHDGKLYVYVEVYEEEKHNCALAKNSKLATYLLVPREVLGEVFLNAIIPSPNGEGSNEIVTSFEKENFAANFTVFQDVLTLLNVIELRPSSHGVRT